MPIHRLLIALLCLGLFAGMARAVESRDFGAFTWTAPAIGAVNSLGVIGYAPPGAKSGISLLQPIIASAAGALTVRSVTWSPGAAPHLVVTFALGSGIVHVTVAPTASGALMASRITADSPVIAALDPGPWTPSLAGVAVPLPYYSGTVVRLPRQSLFANAWFDWKTSGGSQESGTAVQYLPRTDGTRVPLDERLDVAVSPHLDAVLPEIDNPASPERDLLAGRMVIDVWGGDFAAIASGLATLGSYGITNCLVIIHDWQHAGYDNALPGSFPANAALGGNAGLAAATAAARENACRVAVHENYIDYYPNYPKFDPAAIGLDSDGNRILSWLNTSTGIQSFSTKPTWMVRNAATQSPLIHKQFQTSAGFIDVDSSVEPWFEVDMDATQPGAGRYTTRFAAFRSLWAYERATHDGPILGEGNHHWYYAGLVDGAEAQLGAGLVVQNQGADIPLLVDFDLQRIHPLVVNHGMGYYERWTPGGAGFASTVERDAYRTQEIAFGHAPFLGTWDWNDPPFAMIERNLVGPVAKRYGTAETTEILYRMDDNWVSVDQAAPKGALAGVRVTYDDGLVVVANGGNGAMAAGGREIPGFGWVARAPDLFAFSAACGLIHCDYARTPVSLFANARNQSDLRIGNSVAAPSVALLRSTGPGSFDITYDWQVYAAIPLSLTAFVHFVDDKTLGVNEGIVFQGDHVPKPSTNTWKPGQTITDGPQSVGIPSSVAPGTYSIRVGLYDPTTGDRYPLAGDNDGTNRIIIGTITIGPGRKSVSLGPPPKLPNDPRLNAAGAILDFPDARTDGMFALDQEGGDWVLRPFPRSRSFTLELASADYPMPVSVEATGGSTGTVKPVADGPYWRLPLNGASAYRWKIAP